MPEKYCIMPECPYCPVCQFFYQDISGCETYEDTQDLDWGCTCTKEQYEKYMSGDRNEEGEWR